MIKSFHFETVLQFVMVGFLDLTSLRGKITSLYIALVIGIIVLAIVDLLFLEKQLSEGKVISDIKNTVLEMRLQEKNFFLYKTEYSLIKAQELAKLALKMLNKNEVLLNSLLSEKVLLQMQESIKNYLINLKKWYLPTAEQISLINDIRIEGQKIYRYSLVMSKQEQHTLDRVIQSSNWFLLISLLLIGLVIIYVAKQLKRLALTPLEQLESKLKPIADGRYNHLKLLSNDREFVTFTNAFNKMLRELERRQKRLLQAEKLASLGILSSGVAHELNNPLSNISTSCQLLIEEINEAKPEQIMRWLEQIDSETLRAKNIVKTLLNFGRQRDFCLQTEKLSDLLNDTQALVGEILTQAVSTLKINVADKIVLDIDKQRVQQLFINVIQNAINAGKQNVNIRISATICNPSLSLIPDTAQVAGNLECINNYKGELVEVIIADDGPGIDADILSKIFDPFFTTSEPGYGAGLGLYIVQEVMAEHSGCLAIVSDKNSGTKVILLFPVGIHK